MDHSPLRENPHLTVMVFPLPNMTFYPATSKPLHIFEPRYLKMIEDAIDQKCLIALANASPDRQDDGMRKDLGDVKKIAGVGTPVVLQKRPDGTLLIVVNAVGKVQLGSLLPGSEPYIRCEGTWIEEENTILPENLFLVQRLEQSFKAWLQGNVANEQQREAFIRQMGGPRERINYLCSLMIKSPEAQQQLLEADDINDRIKAAGMILDNDQTTQTIH